MKPFTRHMGIVAPLDRANVDTDAIIPARFLTSISRTGYDAFLFDGWRFRDRGQPGMARAQRTANPDFVLNRPEHQGASILLARDNFGCGSSREHAVWALQQFGFRAVIAPSFGDIFRQNSLKNGLLVIDLPASDVEALFAAVQARPRAEMQIDLEAQSLDLAGGPGFAFAIEPERKRRLVLGLDDVTLTLADSAAIRAFQAAHWAQFPWLPGAG